MIIMGDLKLDRQNNEKLKLGHDSSDNINYIFVYM